MDDKLNNKLEILHRQIHTELETGEQLDDDKRRILEHLQLDIAAALEQDDEEQRPFLLNRLREAVDEFEISHPNLTLVIGHAMDVLSRSGI